MSSSGFPSIRKVYKYWRKPNRNATKMKGVDNLSYVERLRSGTVQPGKQKAQSILSMSIIHMNGGWKECGAK